MRRNFAVVLSICVLLLGTTMAWKKTISPTVPAVLVDGKRRFVGKSAVQGLCRACESTFAQYLPNTNAEFAAAMKLTPIPTPFCANYDKKSKIYRKCNNLRPTIYEYIRSNEVGPDELNAETCKSIPHPKKKGKMACEDSALWKGKTCKACESIMSSWPNFSSGVNADYVLRAYNNDQELYIAAVEFDQWVRENAGELGNYVARVSGHESEYGPVLGVMPDGMGVCQGLDMCAGPDDDQTSLVTIGALKVLKHLVERSLKRLRDVEREHRTSFLGKVISLIPKRGDMVRDSVDWELITLNFDVAKLQLSSWTRKLGDHTELWGILSTELGNSENPDEPMRQIAIEENITTLDLKAPKGGASLFDLAVKTIETIDEERAKSEDEQEYKGSMMNEWEKAKTHMANADVLLKKENAEGFYDELKMCEAHLLTFMEILRKNIVTAIWEVEW